MQRWLVFLLLNYPLQLDLVDSLGAHAHVVKFSCPTSLSSILHSLVVDALIVKPSGVLGISVKPLATTHR